MMGSPSGSSGTGTGANANVYTPTAQPAADQMYQNIVQNLNAQGFGPAGVNYPTGQGFVDQYITGSPYVPQALQGAQNVAGLAGQFLPYEAGAGYSLLGGANNALPYANQAMAQAFNPLYQQIVDYTQQNPYFDLALSGASQAASIGGQGASNLQNPIYAGINAASPLLSGAPNAIQYGQSVYNAAAPIQNMAQTVAGRSGDVWNAAQQVAGTAFDPQQSLFNRTQGELTDQMGAINAMSGVGGTPYGAGVTGKTLSDFDINWQNQQLGRQQAGLGALGSGLNASVQGLGALGAGQQALNTGAGAYNAGLGAYGGALGQYGNALTSALGNLGGTANLGATTAAMPSATYTNQLGSILNALKAQQSAGVQGAASYGGLLGAAQGAYGQGANLLNTGAQQYLAGTQQPYNTGLGIANNALSGLSNVTNLGQQQYALPESVLNNLAAYLRLGQAASGISGQLGNLGFNQTAQGLGGLLGGANALFGNNSLLGGSQGIFGNSGLLGATGLGNLIGGGGGITDAAGNVLGSSLAGIDTATLDAAAGAGGLGGGGLGGLFGLGFLGL